MNSRKKKRKASKPTKKSTRVKKSARALSKLSKRPRKDVYDVFLKSGAKTQSEINEAINKLRTLRELPDNRVKLTFVARYRKKISSISYNYDIDEPEEINEALTEILHSIFTRPVRATTKSLKRMNRLKNYINRIIIDFETATN